MNTNIKSVDEYIRSFPKEVQCVLESIRSAIKERAPGAEESISYGIPAYKLNGKPLVYFAGYKTHIGFYATPSGHSAFAEELSNYKIGKASVKFPLNKSIPYKLLNQIIDFRVIENLKSEE